jgi:hypothetical protein
MLQFVVKILSISGKESGEITMTPQKKVLLGLHRVPSCRAYQNNPNKECHVLSLTEFLCEFIHSLQLGFIDLPTPSRTPLLEGRFA